MAGSTQESYAVPIPMSSRQIADDLQDRIARGEYAPGAELPSYRELAQLYSVSVRTAATVYRILVERGVAVGSIGRAMFVRESDH
jgi:GntR family transcriptional regulator